MYKKRNWQALFSPSTSGTREFYALILTDLRPYQNRICRITHWKWMYLYFHYIKPPYFRTDIKDMHTNLNALKREMLTFQGCICNSSTVWLLMGIYISSLCLQLVQ